MITKTIAAGLIAVTSLAAVPANATSVTIGFGNGPGWGHPGQHWQNHRVSPERVRWQLQREGYRAIRFFDTRGAVYQVRASKHGRNYFLMVSARSGEVISRHRV